MINFLGLPSTGKLSKNDVHQKDPRHATFFKEYFDYLQYFSPKMQSLYI